MNDQVTFTRQGLVQGAVKMLPIALVDVPFAIVMGVLARQAGMSMLEVVLMSVLVFAGASQVIAVGLWATPVPVFTLVLTTLIVNLRHLMMGAALRPWFSKLGPLKTYTSAHFITDESWALAIREFKNGGRDAAFLMGSGLTLFVLWVSGTAAGHLLGAGISSQDLVAWGLDFVVTAVFVGLAVSLWRGKSDLVPWAVAAVVSFGAYLLLPGTRWYILLGGLAGSIVGAFRDGD